ncbi:MAG: hypothetical protein E7049_03110 [Lentisphaerae bacterium]|nr:hypothetical protein [Lentisphaerota bacterium]
MTIQEATKAVQERGLDETVKFAESVHEGAVEAESNGLHFDKELSAYVDRQLDEQVGDEKGLAVPIAVGAVKAARAGCFGKEAKSVSAYEVAVKACEYVDRLKTLKRLGENKITEEEAAEEASESACVAVCTMLGKHTGGAIGSLFGEKGEKLGEEIGKKVGKFVGCAVGKVVRNVIVEGSKAIANYVKNTVVGLVQAAGRVFASIFG